MDNISKLQKLIALTAQYNNVRNLRLIKTISDGLEQQVENMGKYIDEQANKYKQNGENVNNIKKEYKDSLDNILTKYTNGLTMLENAKQVVESKKIEAIARMQELKKEKKAICKTDAYKNWKKAYDIYVNEAEKIGKSGDMQKYEEAMKEVKRMEKESPVYQNDLELNKGKIYIQKTNELLEKYSMYQENWKEVALDAKQESLETKDNKLVEIKKQSVFQRIVGAITNRFGGAKKFNDNVVNPIKKNINTISSKVMPNMEEKGKDIFPEINTIPKVTLIAVLQKAKGLNDKIVKGISNLLDDNIQKMDDKINGRVVESPVKDSSEPEIVL